MQTTTPVSRMWFLQWLWWWCAITGYSSCMLQGTTAKYHPQPATSRRHVDLLAWGVEVVYDRRRHSTRHIDRIADSIADDIGLINTGRIGSLQGLYQLDHPLHNKLYKDSVLLTPTDGENLTVNDASRPEIPEHWTTQAIGDVEWREHFEKVRLQLESHGQVVWFTQLHAFRRRQRDIQFEDPAFPRQWHLVNTKRRGHDLDIMRVWERNVTGKGVVVAVVDDGLEWTNPDIKPNYYPDASYDLNHYDRDPMPSSASRKNHHGTRCAGEIAAAANSVCAVGVAYKSSIAGLKVLDGMMTDSLEGVAFSTAMDLIDIYSCSWGPDDDGMTVDGPHYITMKALREAVNYGRNGYGNVFVVASGNGGKDGDNCNFDGYANSIYTVTIGAVDEYGAMPYYAEECASMLAVTYSSGAENRRSIVTTDWRLHGGTGCTDTHTGTSAAAPLAAGIIALMLETRPCLTWRDVQHLIVMTAVKVDIDMAHWTLNRAGFHHSHKHGFGLLDAWRLVNAAKVWNPVPWLTLYSTDEMDEYVQIPPSNQELKLSFMVDTAQLWGFNLLTLEYVHVVVTLDHAKRGSLEIRLICPSGTHSILAATRAVDVSAEGFDHWTFSTVRCWGEQPQGEWILLVRDTETTAETSRGVFKSWQLKLYGSSLSSQEVRRRIMMVEQSFNGDSLYDNISLPCPPPPLRNKKVKVISRLNLKILMLASAFCFILAIYETFDYLLCFENEKKKFADELEAASQQRQEHGDAIVGEGTRLLESEYRESIQMDSMDEESVYSPPVYDPVGRPLVGAPSVDSSGNESKGFWGRLCSCYKPAKLQSPPPMPPSR